MKLPLVHFFETSFGRIDDKHFILVRVGEGQRVFEAQQMFDMPAMYAAIFAAGALGYGLNLLFLTIERRFVHWSGK